MDFRILKWIKFCALWKFLEKSNWWRPTLRCNSALLQRYTPRCCITLPLPYACHAALRYFPPIKPYLPSARCVFSFFFSSSTSGRQSQAAAAAFVARSALLLYCLLAAAAALLCCCATICLTPVLLLCYLLAAAAGEPEPPLPFQAAAKVERQRRPSNALCTGPRRPILRRAAPVRCRRPPSQSTAMPPPSSPGAAPCNSRHRPARRRPPLGLLLS
jgi:hypothetical protein